MLLSLGSWEYLASTNNVLFVNENLKFELYYAKTLIVYILLAVFHYTVMLGIALSVYTIAQVHILLFMLSSVSLIPKNP